MTLEQLRIFTAVADMLNMTKAASRLHLTQPAVSAAIAALEDRHSTKLFDRVGRRLELTAEGKRFLPEAHAVLARADDAKRVLDDLAGLLQGEVRIAASQTVATYWLPNRMASFAVAHPGISLDLRVGNTTQAAALLNQGDVDVAFVESDSIEFPLESTVVGADHVRLYASMDSPLAGRPLTPACLEAATWVMREPGSGTRDHLTHGLARSGVNVSRLNICLQLPSNGAVLQTLENKALIAGISDLAAAPRVKAGQIVELPWPLPARNFKMLRHPERRLGRATAAFVQSLLRATSSP
ncbi:LysR family transcriptional regulator [Achromobacter aloeverae]